MRIPRTFRLPAVHRWRVVRHYVDKIPGGRLTRCGIEAAWRDRIARHGTRLLRRGQAEGRRLLTALPHQLSGIGHSSSEWNTAYLWAADLGLTFVNTPMPGGWNRLLGFGAGALTYDEVMARWRPTVVRLPYVEWNGPAARPLELLCPVVDTIRSADPLLFVLADGQNAYDQTPNAARLRSEFLAHGGWRDIPLHAEAGRTNVAVHVRRGDVAAMKQRGIGGWETRYVHGDWFLQIMQSVAAQPGMAGVVFHIYSQGSRDEFTHFTAAGDCRFHLDCSEYECFVNMVFADVLVMSPSGFSYLAGLLSTGRKIARVPWWHHLPDDPNWTLVASP